MAQTANVQKIATSGNQRRARTHNKIAIGTHHTQ